MVLYSWDLAQHWSFITVSKWSCHITQAFCRILDSASSEINALKTTIIAGKPVVNLGKKADEICNSVRPLDNVLYHQFLFNINLHAQALERFAAEAPIPDNSPESEALYDKKVSRLFWFIGLASPPVLIVNM